MPRKKAESPPDRKPRPSGRTRTLEEREAAGQVRILLSLDKQWAAKLALVQSRGETNQATLRRLIQEEFERTSPRLKKST